MTHTDQFESVFRSASKTVFAYHAVHIASVLVITDLDESESNLFAAHTRQFLSGLSIDETPAWTVIGGDAFHSVRDMLDVVERVRPDLVCTYRHLHSEGWKWPFTLGDHLEVLTQATTTPVVVMPHPRARAEAHALQDTNSVLAITDHLTGDDRLVNFAIHFTERGGTLRLAHVEDEATYDRFVEVISKIPELDTEIARDTIRRQLLKEPHDYIESCRRTAEEHELDLTIESAVRLGRQMRVYADLVDEHRVDLLVMNTKDEDQMAMHGLAYPIAVELRSIPILML